MISIDEAWERIASRAAPLEIERVALERAAGRVLAETLTAPIDLPPFDRSAMDGYAVRAADVAAPGARLRIAGDVPAGSVHDGVLAAGHALGISTGAAIPAGADAVVMVEVTERDGDEVVIGEAVLAGTSIRRRGEDVSAGSQLLGAGVRLAGRHLGLLAGSGIAEVAVHRAPRLGVLVTGSELVPAGGELAGGQIFESNGVTLRALARDAGAELVELVAVPDDPAAIRGAIEAGLACDVLLITGGVSVGEHDHVKDALAACGAQTRFWKVAMKPGKPTLCARHDRGWAFGLPGNPLSSVVAFHVFVAPLLRVLDGEPAGPPRTFPARLLDDTAPAHERTSFECVTLTRGGDGALEATPLGARGSAMTKMLADADGFAVVEPQRGAIRAGAMVDVIALGELP